MHREFGSPELPVLFRKPLGCHRVDEKLRKSEEKRRTGLRLGFDPDASRVPLYNPLADCKSQSGSRDVLAMKPFERLEDLALVLPFNADAIIGDGELNFATLS